MKCGISSGSLSVMIKNNLAKDFFLNYNLTPLGMYNIPSLLYQTIRKNPLIYKGLIKIIVEQVSNCDGSDQTAP